MCGPGSSVGRATDYGLDGPEIETRWGEISAQPDRPRVHTTSGTIGTGPFPGVKYGRGMLLTTHPLLVPWSWKSRTVPLPPSGPHYACNGKPLALHIQGVSRLVDITAGGDLPGPCYQKSSY